MSLLFGVLVLSVAVAFGGLAAFSGAIGARAVPVLRAFAVVAASSIALVHLLPEAIATVGFWALGAAFVGAVVPAVLERIAHPHHHHAHDAPTTALAMGYAAVIVHQAGEGATLATLANTGALSAGIVIAIAAHTVPLAMVVALRVLESQKPAHAGEGADHHDARSRAGGGRRATMLALLGVAGATAVGAAAGNLVGEERLGAVEPWVLAGAAGLLLHALSHDVFERPQGALTARLSGAGAGLMGIAVAFFGVEDEAFRANDLPSTLRIVGVAVVAIGVVARTAWPAREPASQPTSAT